MTVTNNAMLAIPNMEPKMNPTENNLSWLCMTIPQFEKIKKPVTVVMHP
jgi:hypothetical protein